jgi:hypothetical protein
MQYRIRFSMTLAAAIVCLMLTAFAGSGGAGKIVTVASTVPSNGDLNP